MQLSDQKALELRQSGLDAMWQGRFDEAIETYDAALAVAETDDVRELIAIGKAEALMAAEREGAEINALPEIVIRRRSPRHVYMAAALLMRRFSETDRRRALFYGEIARQATIELGDAFAQATVLNSLGIVLTIESRFGTAIETYDEALAALARVEGRMDEVTRARRLVVGGLGGAKVLAGEHTEGIHLLLGILPELTNDYYRAEALLDVCYGYLELERLEEAEYMGLEALDLAMESRQTRNANHLLGEIMVRSKRFEEADRYFSVVAGFYPQYPNVKELLLAVDLSSVVNWKG
jgi:tetratricopeptide (TPR) repeat protein